MDDMDAMDAMDDPLLEERPAEGVVVLRLNRPAVLNALNLALRQALAAAFTRLDADPLARVIVLAGSERAFCAGADLNEYVDATPTEIIARRMDQLWGALSACSKPVIAAVRGHALGGGCELAMHADIIIAGDSARFAQPEVLLGLMPGGGATQRLTRAVGKFRAMQLLMTGAPFTAARPWRWAWRAKSSRMRRSSRAPLRSRVSSRGGRSRRCASSRRPSSQA